MILRGIYCWVLNSSTYLALNICNTTKPTYLKLKNSIDTIIGESPLIQEKIGGEGVEVQFDETAICNGLIITDPTHMYDDEKGNIQWIIGGVESKRGKNFILELVPNRKKETILAVFQKYVMPGSIIITDGYPSYPWAVKQFGSEHRVVNHSECFSTPSGTNTNQIENIWSHLKQQYRSRGGVNKNRFSVFLREFIWKKKNIDNQNSYTHTLAFLKILILFSTI